MWATVFLFLSAMICFSLLCFVYLWGTLQLPYQKRKYKKIIYEAGIKSGMTEAQAQMLAELLYNDEKTKSVSSMFDKK